MARHSRFDILFEPVRIGPVTAPNRFYAVPHVNGNRVTLDISQQADQAGARGAVQTQRLTTSITGTIGQWIELGGTGQQASQQQGGAFNLSTREMSDQRSIWLKVEEVQ